MENKRKLHKSCSYLWKEICYDRDGKECMVKKYYPEIKIAHTQVFQVDHCVTRACKWTFYMPENGTVVCSACNMAKGFNLKSVQRAIDDIVVAREGMEKFYEMVALDRSKANCIDFNKIWWLEEREALLKEALLHQKLEC